MFVKGERAKGDDLALADYSLDLEFGGAANLRPMVAV